MPGQGFKLEDQLPWPVVREAGSLGFFEIVAGVVVHKVGFDLAWVGHLQGSHFSPVIYLEKTEANPTKISQKLSLESEKLPGMGLARKALEFGKPVIEKECTLVTGKESDIGGNNGEGIYSGAAFPVVKCGQVVAVLVCINRDHMAITSNTVFFLEGLAERIGWNLSLQGAKCLWKSKFITTVAHELRTPITIIQGFAELLLDSQGKELSRDQTQYVKRINEHSNHLLAMFENILDHAKMAVGTLEINQVQVDLTLVCREAADMMKTGFKGRNLSLKLDLPRTPVHVIGDEVRIKQVLINLLSNALKFTKKGEVVIWLKKKQHVAVFGVKDTGIGIGTENQQVIFQEFCQVLEDGPFPAKGIGLGLALCREVVQAHGGTIKVESELGVGSNFIVEIPIA